MRASTNAIERRHYRYRWVTWICACTAIDPEYRACKEWISVQKCHRATALAVQRPLMK